MPINKTWHEHNKMPRNASVEERIRWHLVHQKYCACRPIPAKLMTEIRKRVKRPLKPLIMLPQLQVQSSRFHASR